MLLARLGPENFGCSDFVYFHFVLEWAWLVLADSWDYSGSARSKIEFL